MEVIYSSETSAHFQNPSALLQADGRIHGRHNISRWFSKGTPNKHDFMKNSRYSPAFLWRGTLFTTQETCERQVTAMLQQA
jgi:hypothetical protein